MNSSISKNTFKAIYRLLDKVSPLDDDCGLLCGAACCTCDNCEGADAIVEGASDDADYEMGIYLLPGEEQMFDGDEDWIKWGHLAAEDFDLFADFLDLGGVGGVHQVSGLAAGLKDRVARTGHAGQQGSGNTADADVPGADGFVFQLAVQFFSRFPEQAVVDFYALF